LLPAPALVVWISNIGYGCLTDWVRIGPEGMSAGEAAQCFQQVAGSFSARIWPQAAAGKGFRRYERTG
jgi:hypothetical protein